MKYLAIALACLLVAAPVRADGPIPTPFDGPATTYEVAQEFDRLVGLLGDDVLRELVCRLSYERYTPGTLSYALHLPRDEVMRRVDVLRGWGLVRTFTGDNTIVEPSPGKGLRTLRRWAARYCAEGGACGIQMPSEQVRKDGDSEKRAAGVGGQEVAPQNILRRLKITIGTVQLLVELFDTPTANAIYKGLPFKSSAQIWGNEVYFAVPVHVSLEADAQAAVKSGELAFWVEGNAIVVAFGPRRISKGMEIRLAPETNIWGRAVGDVHQFIGVSSDEKVTVEAAE